MMFKVFALMLLNLLISTGFVFAGTSPMITEWNIPATNTTIMLPIPANSSNSYTVDWGDNIVETFDSTSDFPSHTYSEACVHTIQITSLICKCYRYELYVLWLYGISRIDS